MNKTDFSLQPAFTAPQTQQYNIKKRVFSRLIAALATLALVLAPIFNAAAQGTFPAVISLPNGFQPEGIAVGHGPTFYAGSIPTGAIYRGSLRTGEGQILVEPQQGRAAIGLKYDDRSGYLFVAGGPTGQGYVYDGETGESLAVYTFTAPTNTFINDVIVTRQAAYFTNSFQPEIYKVSLGPGGELVDPGAFETISLSGDYVQQPGFNANGIAASPNGEWLIIVQSNTGFLYRVDPQTGIADQIELAGGATVVNGDGILLQGHTLYVVQNADNQISVVELSPDYSSGEVEKVLTDAPFRVPTTIARFGSYLYAVNARFDTPPTPDTEYEVVQVSR